MSSTLVVFCSAFIVGCFSANKTFQLYSGGKVGGNSASDYSFQRDRCAEDGLEPAKIENAQDNANAYAVCGPSQYCYIGLVTDATGSAQQDVTNWYWLTDGQSLGNSVYSHWNPVSPQNANDYCAIFDTSYKTQWADLFCNSPQMLLCQTPSSTATTQTPSISTTKTPSKSRCKRLDIDGYLEKCSAKYGEITDNIDTVESQIDTNAQNITTNLAKIVANKNSITANLAKIIVNKAEFDNFTQQIQSQINEINTALAELAKLPPAAHAVNGKIDDDSKYVLSTNNIILLVSLAFNALLVACCCYTCFQSKQRYQKVTNYIDPSDSEQ